MKCATGGKPIEIWKFWQRIGCSREGIKPGAYYAWTKDFMEAGKERLTRDTVRDATRQEIDNLKRENAELKQLVADLSLDVYRLKKTAIPPLVLNGDGV